jgi:periplasmic divalent cation tolerance protein
MDDLSNGLLDCGSRIGLLPTRLPGSSKDVVGSHRPRGSSAEKRPHMDAQSVRLILTTVADAEAARALARELVAGRFAACVNIVTGVSSVYRWRDRVEEEAETLLLIKTTAERLPALVARLEALHPYEVPEVLAFAGTDGGAPYLNWLAESTEEA